MSARHRVALALSLALAAAGGCGHAPWPNCLSSQRSGERVEAARAMRDPQVIKEWLECEECLDGELAAVAEFGDAAVPMLAAIAVAGMSPGAREALRAQLASRYEARVEYGQRHPGAEPSMEAEAYLRHHLDNRDHLYRVRAIRALARIGSESAADVLREIRRQVSHAGIAYEIESALAALAR